MGIYLNQNGEAKRFDGAPGPAASIAYDNTESGLLATSTQGAIDEVNDKVNDTISGNTVELTATAAHTHAVGSTFLWIGQLVKVTTAIAVGDTIAVGTNVTNTDICSILDELNSNKISYFDISKHATVLEGGTTYPFDWTALYDGFLNLVRLVPVDAGTLVTIGGRAIVVGGTETCGGMIPLKKGTVVSFSSLTNSSRAYFYPMLN